MRTVVVNVVSHGRKFKARIVVDGKRYGRQRVFDTEAAALVHVAQMLRVLAEEVAA